MRFTRQSFSTFTTGVALVAIGLLVAAPSSYAAGATSTCTNWRGSGSGPLGGGPNTVTADCKTTSGTIKTSSVWLPGCLANDNGQLVWRKDGYYDRSCRSLAFWPDAQGKPTTAECKTKSGSWVRAIAFMDQLSNMNGTLVCPI